MTPTAPVSTTDQPLNQVKRRARRITWQDCEAIASQVAKRLTESEACHNLGIEPRVWFLFKNKAANLDKIQALLERMRGAQIKAHLENIEQAERGQGPHARADWRASAHLLAIKAPDRFSDRVQASQQASQPMIAESTLRLVLDKLFQQPKPPAIDCEQVKALPGPSTEPSTGKD